MTTVQTCPVAVLTGKAAWSSNSLAYVYLSLVDGGQQIPALPKFSYKLHQVIS
jgi:hypothetical protein